MLVAYGAMIRWDRIATSRIACRIHAKTRFQRWRCGFMWGFPIFLQPQMAVSNGQQKTPAALLFCVEPHRPLFTHGDKAIRSPDGQGGDAFRPGASWHLVKGRRVFKGAKQNHFYLGGGLTGDTPPGSCLRPRRGGGNWLATNMPHQGSDFFSRFVSFFLPLAFSGPGRCLKRLMCTEKVRLRKAARGLLTAHRPSALTLA